MIESVYSCYGSDRLGLYRHEQVVHPAPPIHRGERQYELKNHLGNVMAVVSGHKTPVESTTTPGTVGHYLPQIMHAADYSPFGVTRLSYEPVTTKTDYTIDPQSPILTPNRKSPITCLPVYMPMRKGQVNLKSPIVNPQS